MLLGAVGCTASLLTAHTAKKGESSAHLPQTKTPELNRAWEVRASYTIPFRGIILSHNFLSLSADKHEHLAKTSSTHQAKMRFWHCHVCAWSLCIGLSCQWFSEVVWVVFGGQKDKMEGKSRPLTFLSCSADLLCFPLQFTYLFTAPQAPLPV